MGITKIGEKTYHIDFHPRRGKKRVRRTVKGTRRTAEQIWDELEEQARNKRFGLSTDSKTTVEDLADLVVIDYEINSHKSLHSAKQMHKFWVGLMGGTLADEVSSDTLKDLARGWMKAGLSSGRANRLISFLMRGYSLALESSPPKVSKKPKWRKLREASPRSGFLECEEFETLRDVLPLHTVIPVTIEYWTGMRSGEVHGLIWPQIRFEHKRRTVFIQLADSKTGEPRLVALPGDLYDVIYSWHKHTLEHHPACQYVCHYNGKKLGSIKTAWKTACVKVGLGSWTKEGRFPGNRGYRGRTVHDLRRTGVRNLIRAGVPAKTAMAISGHKTRAVFDRYNIINEEDLIEAGEMVVIYHERKNGSARGQSVDTPTPNTRKTPRQTPVPAERPADS